MGVMNVILLERVENLGQMGDVVRVKHGFARNFLLPQKKALRASKDNLAFFESRKAQLQADNLKKKGEAEAVAAKMTGVAVVIIRQAGESGQLYGSVAARDVAEGLTKAGYTVGKSQIVIDKPIKTIGIFDVRVVLHPEVSVAVAVNVAQSDEEAQKQAERKARGEDPVVLARTAEAEQMAAEAAAAAPAPEAADEPAAAEDAPKEKKAKKAKADKAEAAEPEADSGKGKKDKGKKK
jgi:large subunit ribosomal protein L9